MPAEFTLPTITLAPPPKLTSPKLPPSGALSLGPIIFCSITLAAAIGVVINLHHRKNKRIVLPEYIDRTQTFHDGRLDVDDGYHGGNADRAPYEARPTEIRHEQQLWSQIPIRIQKTPSPPETYSDVSIRPKEMAMLSASGSDSYAPRFQGSQATSLRGLTPSSLHLRASEAYAGTTGNARPNTGLLEVKFPENVCSVSSRSFEDTLSDISGNEPVNLPVRREYAGSYVPSDLTGYNRTLPGDPY